MNEFIDGFYPDKKQYAVYIIDSVHQETGLRERLRPASHDLIMEFNASLHEPKTSDIDAIRDEIIKQKVEEVGATIEIK